MDYCALRGDERDRHFYLGCGSKAPNLLKYLQFPVQMWPLIGPDNYPAQDQNLEWATHEGIARFI